MQNILDLHKEWWLSHFIIIAKKFLKWSSLKIYVDTSSANIVFISDAPILK